MIQYILWDVLYIRGGKQNAKIHEALFSYLLDENKFPENQFNHVFAYAVK